MSRHDQILSHLGCLFRGHGTRAGWHVAGIARALGHTSETSLARSLVLPFLCGLSGILFCVVMTRRCVRLTDAEVHGGQRELVVLAEAIKRETSSPIEQIAAVQSAVLNLVTYQHEAAWPQIRRVVLGQPMTFAAVTTRSPWAGDCKGRALVAIALLRTLGFTAHLVSDFPRAHMYVEVQAPSLGGGRSISIMDDGGPFDLVQRLVVPLFGSPYHRLPYVLDGWFFKPDPLLKHSDPAKFAVQVRDRAILGQP